MRGSPKKLCPNTKKGKPTLSYYQPNSTSTMNHKIWQRQINIGYRIQQDHTKQTGFLLIKVQFASYIVLVHQYKMKQLEQNIPKVSM